jgi:hypothetical protein
MPPNEIDILMARMAEINAKDPPLDASDIATLIANARRQRQLKSSGTKPSRAKADIKSILDIVRAAEATEPAQSSPSSSFTFTPRRLP